MCLRMCVFERSEPHRLEEDADRELDELKEMYDKRLWAEQDAEQKYAAENGILKLRCAP